jgi:prolyl-tRNA editing enzyme YbaK/EbsC (Cys-tRNA(Pro) deacylase)
VEDLSPAARRVHEALRERGVHAAVTELPGSTRTAQDAAATVGCDVGAIANSLVFVADGEPVLVLTSGRHRVHEARLADRIGAEKVRRATPDEVAAATGQRIGGVSPVGHPTPVRTFVDEALAEYSAVWAAAGTPQAVYRTTLDELVRATGGRVLPVDWTGGPRG